MINLKISSKDYSIKKVEGGFNRLRNISHNGQYWQIPGCFLATVDFSENWKINLYHYVEDPRPIGHISVIVELNPKNVVFRRYSGNQAVRLDNLNVMHKIWPSGSWSLLMAVIAIEEYLEKTIGYKPILMPWIIREISS